MKTNTNTTEEARTSRQSDLFGVTDKKQQAIEAVLAANRRDKAAGRKAKQPRLL